MTPTQPPEQAGNINEGTVLGEDEYNLLLSSSLEKGEDVGRINNNDSGNQPGSQQSEPGRLKAERGIARPSKEVVEQMLVILPETDWGNPIRGRFLDFTTRVVDITQSKQASSADLHAMRAVLEGSRRYIGGGDEHSAEHSAVRYLSSSLTHLERAAAVSKEHLLLFQDWSPYLISYYQISGNSDNLEQGSPVDTQAPSRKPPRQEVRREVQSRASEALIREAIRRAWEEVGQASDASNTIDGGPKREALLLMCDLLIALIGLTGEKLETNR